MTEVDFLNFYSFSICVTAVKEKQLNKVDSNQLFGYARKTNLPGRELKH